MNGSEPTLRVYLGRDLLANLVLINDELHWFYTDFWKSSGFSVSPHLPLIGEISPLNTQRFLRNLLPEGAGLEELINSFHLSLYNTFGIIRTLGLDTPGSLVFLPHEQSFPLKPFFRSISSKELEERLDKREDYGLILWDGKPRLSVAGVQDKINVIVDEEGRLGFGEGSLCSTHILKFEKQKLAHLVINEYLTMQLAQQCGLQVAKVKLMRFGTHPALLVERFDRQFISLEQVKRRHIIDGCQALNLPPEYKYERNFGSGRDVAHIRDGASLIKLFQFSNHCENPAVTKSQLLDWVLFNILVYNCDAHGKNISFYVGNNGLSLAPFYDLVNIKMYPEFEHELAMGLGDEFDGNDINAYQLADFADTCQLPRQLVTNRLKFLIKKLTKAFEIGIELEMDREERIYLRHYQEMVERRCQHLLKESKEIAAISF